MPVNAARSASNSLPEADITNYWQHYGLHYDPFAIEIDEQNYYSLPRWEEHLDLLQFLCHYNNVLLAVTGNSGSGKTVLLQQFHKQIAESMKVCEIKASSSFTCEQLIELFNEVYHAKVDSKGTLEQHLDNQVAQLQESQKICLLLIDDAHLLPLKILRTFLSLIQQQSETQMKLHVVLFGEPNLQNNLTRLTQAEGGEEFVHVLQLGLLSLEETESYLQHRLLKAGFVEMPLVQTVINRIYKLSGGVPGRINRIARRTLLNDLLKKLPDEKRSFMRDNKAKIMGAFLVTAALAATALAINAVKGNEFQFAKVKKIDSLLAFNHNKLPTVTVKQQPSPILTFSAPVTPLKIPAPVQILAQIPAPTVASLPQSIALPATVSLPVSHTIQNPAPAESIPANNQITPQAPPVIMTSTQLLPQEPTAISIPAAEKPFVGPAVPANPVQRNFGPTRVVAIVKTVAPKAEPAKQVQVKQVQAVKPGRYSTSEKRLLAINSSNYGLQLLGLSNEAAVKRFIKANNLTGKVNYYHTSLKGKDWYVLIYGQFQTPTAAKQALKKLPAAVQDLHPWVRGYDSVHAAIKSGK